MMKKIGLGFVGCGKHALRSHGVVAASLEYFSIVAVFDPSQTAMNTFVELEPRVNKTADADELINHPNVNAVIIATPPQFHLDLMEGVVNAKKHVLCEKPLWVGDGKRGRIVIKKAVAEGLVFTSCHPRRYEPPYQIVRARTGLYQERFGKLLSFNFRFFYHKPSTDWRKADSLLLDHMNHEIDLLNFLFGVQTVKLHKVYDGYDRYEVVGETKSGVSICFSGSRRLENRVYRNELELVFERGRVVALANLTDGFVKGKVVETDFDHQSEEISYEQIHQAEIPFSSIMTVFANCIWGLWDNYLTPEEMIINTESCNTLIKTGAYAN